MKTSRLISGWLAISLASCSSAPTGPTAATAPTAVRAADGTVTSAAVTTTRVRLRRVDGGDIMTGLQNGQVINVPLNVKLDIWAEIARLEADRARLVVDWGNGNNDFQGCGACKLENTYTREGRYTVTIRVVDLNAPAGTEAITAITVTLNVIDSSFKCDTVSSDFESVLVGTSAPFSVPGFSLTTDISASVFNISPSTVFAPYASGNLVQGGRSMTLTFTSDKNFFTSGFLITAGQTATYSAFSASGTLIASGSVGPLALNGSFPTLAQGIAAVSSQQPFRSVTITNAFFANFILDNVSAGCR